MSNGADSVTIQEVLLALTAEIHRMNGKIDGLVTHERFAELLTANRRDFDRIIELTKQEAKQDTSDAESRIRDLMDDLRSDTKKAMRATAKEEVKIGFQEERAAESHQIKRLRIMAVTGTVVGGGGGVVAIIMAFFRGMGAS